MFLTLISNENGADSAGKFRPIALCNVIFKIITKTISNRLKTILLNLVSKEQSGYIECRQILDGIILSHEIVHSLKATQKNGMLIKLDLSKAFNKLNWDFMKKMLIAFGFVIGRSTGSSPLSPPPFSPFLLMALPKKLSNLPEA